MRKKMFFIITCVAAMAFASYATADTNSKAYMKALEHGDSNAAYRARSYFAPPYCYDLNRWHGVKFIKAINGRVIKPTYPFIYQDMTHLKVRKLSDRAGIEDMVKASQNELELIRNICDWAGIHFSHMQPLPYPSWDAHEILDRSEKGDAFWCTYKAVLFVQACNAAGLTGRILGISSDKGHPHTVSEVYINDFRKWMLVDPYMNCYVERNGVPLSAHEFHDAFFENPDDIYIVYGKYGKGRSHSEYWTRKTGKSETISYSNKRIPLKEEDTWPVLPDYYYDIRIVLRNDHTVHPQPKENISVDGYMVPYNPRGGEWWGPQLHWTDDKTPPLLTCDNTGEINDFEWPLNEVKVDLKKISVPGESLIIAAKFTTLTPNFSHYRLEIDDTIVSLVGDEYTWKIHDGKNSLNVASINDIGRNGFPSRFDIEYDSSLIDFSRTVTVKLENPGFEEAVSGQKPSNWRTIVSNPLHFKEFLVDSKVNHSGKYALKATPARDIKTDIEYAFIVSSDTFEVNPVTEGIYTIWLKASKDNTPVDIFLHDRIARGERNYVKRVIIDKKWKKYELKCRLHNEITKAAVGFKVYTGTVWADDAVFEELKR